MNNLQKRAGQSTRDMAEKRYRQRVWFVLLTVGAVILILLVANNSKALGIGGLGFLGLIILGRIIMNLSGSKAKRMVREERRAVRGAKGEEKIGGILENLGKEYLILHDIESPYGNIDHIVISQQSGIFLLETKAHGGRVSVNDGRLLVNGHAAEKDFIAQTLNNTYWLRDKILTTTNIDVWIAPVVVFTNAFVERTDPVKGITITNKKFLLGILQKPNVKPQNPAVWENRERIMKALYPKDDGHP
jgi:hypothetical protein